MISSKKGKLYLRFIIAAAVFAALASAIFTLADSPSAVPRAVSAANASTINVTSAFAAINGVTIASYGSEEL